MTRFTSPLANLKVASPCTANWDGMLGSDRVRFCGQCELNVYNLSAMSRDEAESLIARTEGRLCVRFYRRQDGSILTQDCPVGLGAIRQRASRIRRAAASAVFGFLAGVGGTIGLNRVEGFLIQSNNWGHTQGVMAVPEVQPPIGLVVGKMEENPFPLRRLERAKRRQRR